MTKPTASLWSSDEDDQLLQLWLDGNLPIVASHPQGESICGKLTRSVNSVVTRLWKLSSGYIPYLPSKNRLARYGKWTDEDYAILSCCVNPEGIQRGMHEVYRVADLLGRNVQDVGNEMERLGNSTANRIRRITTPKPEEALVDRARRICTALGHRYGFDKGLNRKIPKSKRRGKSR